MPPLDPYDLTVARCAELLRGGEASAVELTELFLARAEAGNPALNAFLVIDREGALAAAQRCDDDERRAGRVRGPLHGVPIAHKDLLDTAGLPTTGGSDTHRIVDVACAFTCFDDDIENESDLVEALRGGACHGTDWTAAGLPDGRRAALARTTAHVSYR